MMDDHEKFVKEINKVYDKSALIYGTNSKAVLWNDQQSQYFRFIELVKYLDLYSAHKSILDIGCGNGSLYRLLNFMGYRGSYTGYDINDSLIEQAMNEFEAIDVQKKDIMLEPVDRQFDYVLMSGLFNINVGQSTEWVYEFIKKMFALAEEILVFNAISTFVNFRQDCMYYLNPLEVTTFCIENLSHRVTLAHHNLPYNYTIAVFKGEDWTSINK